VTTREEIVAAARAYLGAPLRHQGRYQTFDCVGLVLAVAEDLALTDRDGRLIHRADYGRYGPQPVDGGVEREVALRLSRREFKSIIEIEPGDVLVLRAPRVVCHTAIASLLPTGEIGMIHAYRPAKKVIEHHLDESWIRRISSVFYFPTVTA